MAKVVVIDVNLGINLDDLILESAKDLTTNAKEELDGVISAAKAVQSLKVKKTAEKEQNKNDTIIIIEEAFNMLELAGSKGIPVDTIITTVKPHIPNSSAFALRMKTLLSSKDNPYRLVRTSIDGIPHYLFTNFNKTIG